MNIKQNRLVVLTAISTILFCIAAAWDISPLLRGPGSYPPNWRWDYLFVNTLPRIWAPFVVIGILLFVFQKLIALSEKILFQYEKRILLLVMVLFFLFQLSLLYFSRAGMSVLVERIINPEMNGYFTAANSITNISSFLHTYNEIVLKLPMHAQGHPPGAILFFWTVTQLLFPLQHFFSFLSTVHISHADVAIFWGNLTLVQKSAAVVTSIGIPLLSCLSLPLIYFITKLHADGKTAIKSMFFYLFIPSALFFIPINDVFLPLFILSSFLLFSLGILKNKRIFLVCSGICFSFGMFFSLSLLPLGMIFLVYTLFSKISRKEQGISLLLFALGFLLLPISLYVFFGYNTIVVSKTLMSGLPKNRPYSVWVFYNLYDFFIFSGIPMISLFLYACWDVYQKIREKKLSLVNPILLGFISMLCILDVSGSVRGEVARIWIPFYSFLVIGITLFLAKHKISSKTLLILLILQSLQILVMQEFWVMLW